MAGFFKIEHILAVARKHPFYSTNSYPLTPEEVARIKQDFESLESKSYFLKIYQKWAGASLGSRQTFLSVDSMLSEFPILVKEDLYKTLIRLYNDDHPLNTFRYSTYISSSGGGGGALSPLAFLTDIQENRDQRATCGNLMRSCGLLNESDCVLSMHTSGKLYRALDLSTDLTEYAGASALPVGHLATNEELIAIARNFKPNVLCGDTSQLVGLASHIESTGGNDNLRINKVLYTSEGMTQEQREYLQSVFGRKDMPLGIISVFGSAETGAWAVSNLQLTGPPKDDSTDLIFDSRHMIVEVLPLDFHYSVEIRNHPCCLKMNETGQLVMTSLQRLRHPLVRYLIGDIGSIHELPSTTIPLIKGDSSHLRVLRLYGRNLQYSFEWHGEYFDFSRLKQLMSNPDWAILRWQIVLSKHPTISNTDLLEIKLMRRTAQDKGEEKFSLWEEVVLGLKEHFCVDEQFEPLFRVALASAEDFVYSVTGNKVIMFVDRRK